MDGDIFAVKAEKATASSLSDFVGTYQFPRARSRKLTRANQPEMNGTPLLARLMLHTLIMTAAIVATGAAALIGQAFLTESQVTGELMPDLIALLVFFLAARIF